MKSSVTELIKHSYYQGEPGETAAFVGHTSAIPYGSTHCTGAGFIPNLD